MLDRISSPLSQNHLRYDKKWKKTLFLDNYHLKKSLLKCLGCSGLRRDNVSLSWKKVFITVSSRYFRYHDTYWYSCSFNKSHWILAAITNQIIIKWCAEILLNKDNEIFLKLKFLCEFISYFLEYEHFSLDILFCKTPCSYRFYTNIFITGEVVWFFLIKIS